MEFQTLTKEQKKLLLDILEMPIEPKTRGCEMCLTPLTYDNISIMPPIFKEHAILLCDSPVCLSEYFTMLEEKKKKDIV